nr:hypothetical protein [Kofleriaceae bacterium]
MRAWLGVITIIAAACGRLGFDPSMPGATGSDDRDAGDSIGDDAGRDSGGSGSNSGSGSGSGSGSASLCQQVAAVAITTPLNMRIATSTCRGTDVVDACGPPQTQEAIFAFVAPATGGYNFEAFDPGTNNVSNSTTQLDANCVPEPSCAGILGFSVGAGEVAYLVVEADAGGCANIEFDVTP